MQEDSVSRFPCAQCGAGLRYTPGQERLTCEYCGHVNFIDSPQTQEPVQELDFRKALEKDIDTAIIETTKVVECSSCGGTVEFDPNIHAAECVFCASPLVADSGDHRHFKPRGILPFVLSEREAAQALNKWLGSRWFAPSGLKKYARSNKKLSGIYTPYWTFDAQTQTDYAGARGDVYYVTQYVTVMTENGPRRQARQVPKVRWTPVRGRVRRFFDDVLVLGSRSLPKKFVDALAPWDLHALIPYQRDYLAGFRAEAYTVDLQESFVEARAIMDLRIRRDVRFDIGGDQQQISHMNTEFGDISFKHILLPIWIAAYRYRDKNYRFVVNARTGQVEGERPYSAWKIALAFFLGAIAMIIIFMFLERSGALEQFLYQQQGGVIYYSP